MLSKKIITGLVEEHNRHAEELDAILEDQDCKVNIYYMIEFLHPLAASLRDEMQSIIKILQNEQIKYIYSNADYKIILK